MNKETTQQEIRDIVDQLQRLQIQETALLDRLDHLNEEVGEDEGEILGARDPPTNPEAPREFVIGDLVRIKNPNPILQQANKGRIINIKLDTDRITVQPTNGSKLHRAKKNLTFLHG
jgi:hypothetical protein